MQKSTAWPALSPAVLLLASLAVTSLFATASARGEVPTSAMPARPPVARTHLHRPKIVRLSQQLASDDPARVADALDEIAKLGPRAARLSGDLEQLITRGSRPDLVLLAIETLGAVGARESSASLRPYLRHRDPEVRRSTVRALVRIGGPVAGAGLRAALSDPDSLVRAGAAAGLGTLRAADAVVDLLRALGRGVGEAAPAIGQLCLPDQCDAFVALVGSVPFDVWASGFEPLVRRSEAEIADSAKIGWIARLRGIETTDPRPLLKTLLEHWPRDGSDRLRAAIESAVGAAP